MERWREVTKRSPSYETNLNDKTVENPRKRCGVEQIQWIPLDNGETTHTGTRAPVSGLSTSHTFLGFNKSSGDKANPVDRCLSHGTTRRCSETLKQDVKEITTLLPLSVLTSDPCLSTRVKMAAVKKMALIASNGISSISESVLVEIELEMWFRVAFFQMLLFVFLPFLPSPDERLLTSSRLRMSGSGAQRYVGRNRRAVEMGMGTAYERNLPNTEKISDFINREMRRGSRQVLSIWVSLQIKTFGEWAWRLTLR
ncbi:hypothetical protein RRG08_029377 [Elysia crispata]|uniref:Uncharacterized protein n=1 Tax=Elysia crispata TaxID=231223 RepID=A0AAE1B9J5_9GAST|nr:hypothetical protein RRG08_029377 [Elysia crispata]